MTNKKTVVLASAYLAYEEKEPPAGMMRNLFNYCNSNGLELILGCDANAHHTAWGSSDVNGRGERLLDYILSAPL